MNLERAYPFSLVSFAEAVSARSERLREIDGLGEAAIVELKIVEAAAKRIAKSAIEKRLTLSTFGAVVDYCRTAMAFLDHEEFRVLFLDKKNCLIADEVQGVGTVDHAPVYPREIMRRGSNSALPPPGVQSLPSRRPLRPVLRASTQWLHRWRPSRLQSSVRPELGCRH